MFYRDVTDEQFQQLVSQLKPWGLPVLVFHRLDDMRHLETRGAERILHGTRIKTQHGHVAIQDLASAQTHRREGRTVHGHT